MFFTTHNKQSLDPYRKKKFLLFVTRKYVVAHTNKRTKKNKNILFSPHVSTTWPWAGTVFHFLIQRKLFLAVLYNMSNINKKNLKFVCLLQLHKKPKINFYWV